MENPREEITDVVRGLVTKPSLKQQAEVIHRYFTEDCSFSHFLLELRESREDLTAIYQFAQLMLNYQGVEFQNITHDEENLQVVLQVKVHVRPWFRFFLPGKLEYLILVKLREVDADVEDSRGSITPTSGKGSVKKLYKIAEQEDYSLRAPILELLPIVGDIYGSHVIRYLLGAMQAHAFQILRSLVTNFVPASMGHFTQGLAGDWKEDVK